MKAFGTRPARSQEAAWWWCVGPDWLVRQLPQICVLTGCGATFGIPHVSYLLLYRFSFLLTTPVVCRCFGVDLEVALVVSGEWNRSSLLGILLWDWTLSGSRRSSASLPCGRIVTVASKCWRLHFLSKRIRCGFITRLTLLLCSVSRFALSLVGDSLSEGLREEPSMMDKMDSGCFAQ